MASRPEPSFSPTELGSHVSRAIEPERDISNMSEIEAMRNIDLFKVHSPHLDLVEGDTLVFIDFPDPPNDWRRKVNCHGLAYWSQKFRVHSAKLLSTGSSKFADMFKPTYQFRVQRRRKLVNKLPEGVKYVLDLTPPSEGDDLVFQMTELSLTPGIMKWWTASMLHDVDPVLVDGHDDICSCQMRHPDPPPLDRSIPNESPAKAKGLIELPLKPEMLLQMKARGENEVYHTPEERRIPDYCPVRHRNAIVRLMLLIENRAILFNSANVVWTMVGISKIFECTNVVRDQVAQWIMTGNNTTFIEVLPEEALQIGTALEIPVVTQAAFRILVNELALEEAATDKPQRGRLAQVTMFGRTRSYPGDELSNLVQHAAAALVDRVSLLQQQLHHPLMFDYARIEEWNKLRVIEQLLFREHPGLTAGARLILSRLMAALVHMVTSRFDDASACDKLHNSESVLNMNRERATYVEPKHFDTIAHIVLGLNQTQKMLLSFVYNDMGLQVDTPLFAGRHPDHPDCHHRPFADLVKDLETALHDVLLGLPMGACTEGWAPFVVQPPPVLANRSTPLIKRPLISLMQMDEEVRRMLLPVTLSAWHRDIEPQLKITRHMLLTLTNNEFKYLPLWAGGCDDGTGGVFESSLPPTDMGPNGPGPAYHTGHTLPSVPSSVSGSLMEDVERMRIAGSTTAGSLMEHVEKMRIVGSTTAGSVDVNDSISTVYRPDQVIVEDRSIASESFDTGGSDYQNAQFAVPAEHQPMGQAMDLLVEEATDTDSQATLDIESVTESHTD